MPAPRKEFDHCSCILSILFDSDMSGVQQISVIQKLPLDSDSTYYFTCKARLVQNPNDALWATINVHAVLEFQRGELRAFVQTCQKASGNAQQFPGSQRMLHFGKMNAVRKEDGWLEVGGDFATPLGISCT
jgi:hypothetical protein